MSNKVGHNIKDNNKRQSPRPSLAWISNGTDAGASLLRLSLLTSDILLVCLTLMTTTSLAQEENDTTVSSFVLNFPSRPISDEVVINTGETPINETHTIVTFVGNGTMTVPDTGKTINQTNHGYAIISPMTGSPGTLSSYGKETVLSEDDGDTTSFTFYEIIQSDTANPQGKGIMIVVFDKNATGLLAPFNSMIGVGTHEEPLNPEAFLTIWEWQ
jgi:hypothetical protein